MKKKNNTLSIEILNQIISVLNNSSLLIILKKLYGVNNFYIKHYLYKLGLTTNVPIKLIPEIKLDLVYKFLNREGRSLLSFEIDNHIKLTLLLTLNGYRGIKHKKSLPVRGQRTHSNAQTRKRLLKKK